MRIGTWVPSHILSLDCSGGATLKQYCGVSSYKYLKETRFRFDDPRVKGGGEALTTKGLIGGIRIFD